MDTIRINFCGFWGSFQKENNLFYHILSKRFHVEISDDPDFVICSNRGRPFEYMKYNCVRLMFMGENLSPDFTVFDYVIGFDKLSFGDRYFRLPFGFYFDDGIPWTPEALSPDRAREILEQKSVFCNFIYGHPSAHGVRENLFRALETYKPVASPGKYMNNTGGHGCGWAEKYDWLKKSKFTIACDSVSYPGFFTEKVIQPLQMHSVPVYFGNPDICEDINPAAILWCRSSEEAELQRVVEQAAYLDTHDDAYIEMLTQDPLPSPDFLTKRYEELESFLINIFSQPPAEASRRIKDFCANNHENLLKDCMQKNASEPLLIRTRKAAKAFLKK